MRQPNDLSRSLVALHQNSTIIAVVELSHSSWLVAGVVPGIERQPRKKLEPSPERLLALLHRWRDEAVRTGRNITWIALAFEAGRDGFWLDLWRLILFRRIPEYPVSGTDRRYGAGGEEWQLRRCIFSMECRDAPAERSKQIPRRPGPE